MHSMEKQMMRLLHGELGEPEASALRRRLEADPSLSAQYQEIERAWKQLELPVSAVPIGLSTRLRARAAEAADSLSWQAAPSWVRATTAAALVFGVLLGAGLRPEAVWENGPPAVSVNAESSSEEWLPSDLAEPLSLADSYWLLVADEISDGEEGMS